MFIRSVVCAALCLLGVGSASATLISFDFVGLVGGGSELSLFHCADTPNFACASNGGPLHVGDRFGGRYSFETDTIGTVDSGGIVQYQLSGDGILLTVGVNGGLSFPGYSTFIRTGSLIYTDTYEIRTPNNIPPVPDYSGYEFVLYLWGFGIVPSNMLPINPPDIAAASQSRFYRNDGHLNFQNNPSYIDSLDFSLVSITATPVAEVVPFDWTEFRVG